jgi:hypothetical protein
MLALQSVCDAVVLGENALYRVFMLEDIIQSRYLNSLILVFSELDSLRVIIKKDWLSRTLR